MSGPTLTDEQAKKMNDRYRDQQPRDVFRVAFTEAVTTGEVSDGYREEMVDALYDPFPDRMKDTPVDPFEPTLPTQDEGNGLARAVVKNPREISLHVSKRLWEMQPIGVLLRPINDEVRKAGEAVISDVCPRSEDVESGVMPAYHYKLTVEPTPLWVAKWVGHGGYAPV